MTFISGTFSYPVGFTEKVDVPSADTTYMCQGFNLPEGDYHMIATEARIDNLNVAHHIVLYGCHPMSKCDWLFPF